MRVACLVAAFGICGCFNPGGGSAGDGTSSGGPTSSGASNPTGTSPSGSSSGSAGSTTAPTGMPDTSTTTDPPPDTTTTEASTTTGSTPACGNGVVDVGEICFSAAMTINVGPSPRGVATERIDGDDFDDFAVSMSSGSLLTFLGDGTGSFTEMNHDDPDPQGWGRVALGAIADDNVDAIVGEPLNVNVIRFRGLGEGSYSAGTNLGAGGGRMHLLDLDGDDILELAVGVEFGVAIYQGEADETFTFLGTKSAVGTGRELEAGDFDGDGSMDFAVSSDADLGIHFGNGDGTFAPPVEVSTDADIGAMAVADIDGDGADDLLCGTAGDELAVFLGAADQMIADAETVPSSVAAGAMDVADFNDDGAVDVVITSDGDLDLAILLSNP